MKRTLLLFACIFIAVSIFAQTSEIQSNQTAFDGYHKNIFVEGLGAGLLGSINYDMRLTKGRMDGIGFRAGIGGIYADATDPQGKIIKVGILSIPLEVNYLLGKKRSSFIAGIGVLPGYGSIKGIEDVTIVNEQVSMNVDGFDFLGAYLSLGYRFQPLRNGLMFQVNWNPIISGGKVSPSWFGISIGYGFK